MAVTKKNLRRASRTGPLLVKKRNTVNVLFVCMGNICRSPTAEGVFRHLIEGTGLSMQFHIDSAGTIDYHAGAAPDPRAQEAAKKRGYDLSKVCARRVRTEDFVEFDYILAMDQSNLVSLRELYPQHGRAQIELFLRYSKSFGGEDVPDPFYGGAAGFEAVLDRVEDGARGFLEHVLKRNRS